MPRTDGWGDPFVTNAEFAAIRVGMSQTAAFRLLGGQGSNGYYTRWSNPDTGTGVGEVILIHDYPIRGTGNPGPDTMLDDNTICGVSARTVTR